MQDYKVNILPPVGVPNAQYFLYKSINETEHYVTDKVGNFLKVISDSVPITQYIAAQNINSHTPVVLIGNALFKMDILNPTHQFAFVGFTKTSVNTNQLVEVEENLISLNGWGLIPNTQYLAGISGAIQITNNIPNSFTKVVGFAQDSNTLLIIKDYTSINK